MLACAMATRRSSRVNPYEASAVGLAFTRTAGFWPPLMLTRPTPAVRSEEHTSELQSRPHLVCRLLLEKKYTVFPETVPTIGNSFINTMKNINHTRSSISDDIRYIPCSSATMRRAIPLILRFMMKQVILSTNLASHVFDLVIGKILTSRLSLSNHLSHNLGNLLLLGKICVFHNRRFFFFKHPLPPSNHLFSPTHPLSL